MPHGDPARQAGSGSASLHNQSLASGKAPFHYATMTAAKRLEAAQNNKASVFTWGRVGMPTAQAFIGSYDMDWSLVGYDDHGNPVIEFHLTPTPAPGLVLRPRC